MQKNVQSTQHQNLIQKALDTVLELEYTIEEQATELANSFYQQRLEIQSQAQEEENTQALIENRIPKRIFCQLHLSARMNRATLELYWHTVYFVKLTKKKKYKYISKGKSDAYDMRTLLSKAHPFERDLIKETEEQAAIIRLQWKKLIEARKPLHRLRELSK